MTSHGAETLTCSLTFYQKKVEVLNRLRITSRTGYSTQTKNIKLDATAFIQNYNFCMKEYNHKTAIHLANLRFGASLPVVL